MSDETKNVISDEKSYKLSDPTFPSMDMPQRPKTGDPDNLVHMSCEGEVIKPMQDNTLITAPVDGIPRILIGIPILNYSHEFVQSFLKFWTQICTQTQGKMQVGYQFIYRKPVHMAEIEIVEIAQFNKCTHILFMDDDIYDVQVSDLQKLIDADKEVIGGVMYASKFPFAMCVFRRYNTERKVIDMPSDNSMFRLYEIPCNCTNCGYGLSHWDAKFCPLCGAQQDNLIQKADLIPFAFTLMKVSVFDKIKKPWFHCEREYPTDSWFADRCIEAGFQQYAHMGIRLNHNGVNDLTRPFMFNMEMTKQQNLPKNGIVPLSSDEMEKHQYLLHTKMQEAEERLKPRPTMVVTGIKEDSNDSTKSDIT